MTTLLVAHGTRNPHGVRMIGDLAAAMAGALDETVRVAFVDVLGPAPDEVLRTLHDEPTVLVPALLSSEDLDAAANDQRHEQHVEPMVDSQPHRIVQRCHRALPVSRTMAGVADKPR